MVLTQSQAQSTHNYLSIGGSAITLMHSYPCNGVQLPPANHQALVNASRESSWVLVDGPQVPVDQNGMLTGSYMTSSTGDTDVDSLVRTQGRDATKRKVGNGKSSKGKKPIAADLDEAVHVVQSLVTGRGTKFDRLKEFKEKEFEIR
ncbi:hypothetical protein CDL15_Pgr006485 [Punica granatum]|uniref:Uncharacterized protein n=1 Tax=Punica granatum TaxID=22663 RepID=A0A218XYX5_PUNGR|nr:hypothetical protein CDL15_Pgr006485 [Punica granatum]